MPASTAPQPQAPVQPSPCPTAAATPAVFPPVDPAHVSNCALPAWLPRFAFCTLKTRCIPLSEDFVRYLNADGIFLPLDADGRHPAGYRSSDDNYSDSESDNDTDDVGGENNDLNVHPSFPDLQRDIEDTIAEFGGAVFPKLNWSSPKDASWVATGSTLKCVSPSDVYLLLKSSDFVAHDLAYAYESCAGWKGSGRGSEDVACVDVVPTRPARFELVLRKWYELMPSMEFRCFVRDNVLIGISQRDVANYYDFLVRDSAELQSLIQEFFTSNIQGRFPDANYVFDVYINQRNRKVWLLDFNPFSPETDSLLFDWSNILVATIPPSPPSLPDFRVLQSQTEAVGSAHPAYATNRLPRDAVDLSTGETIDSFAERFRRNVYDAI
ncbi:hypothetical protein HDU87_003234 [Geranomyces variabilis]|uniref:Cell division cycle protein 123 n=1 Tax=Geranomyces variabilis TaxID=109894 RepID=A0AAD5TKE6_9FUNG|nr:hypothetical protein HDU87_003234 [Geranomyces variabilis]